MSAYERSTLDNGIRVMAVPMSHVQSTSCYVMLETGSRYETAPENGVAHFVEHMLFCGTPRRPSVRALTGEVDAIGGIFNAGTAKEYTFYYVKCASEYAPQALDVLSDMVRNSLFEPGEVEREKGVIIEEIRAKFDTPRDYVDENFELLVYGDTPLGRLRIGSEETVTGMSRQTIVDFAGRTYRPSRMVIGLAGRIDPSLHAVVAERFGDMGEVGEPVAPAAANGAGTDRVLLEPKQVDQAHLCLGMRAYAQDHPDYHAARLLSTVLGSGMSSRLSEELTMKRGLAYSVFTVAHSHSDAGALWAQGGVNVDKVDEAIEVIVQELHRIAEERVESDELEKARNYSKGRFVFSLETPGGLLMHVLEDEVLLGGVREPEAVLAAMDAVTADDVKRVAGDLLGGGLYLSLIGPYDEAGRFERLIA